MAKSVKWNIAVYVKDGPTLTSSGELDPDTSDAVNAVDTLNVTAGSGDTVVSVQPGDLNKIEFVYIASDQYGDGTNLSYKFAEGSAPADESASVVLEKPHLLTSGNLAALFIKAPKQIKITNSTGSDANIDIVIARQAV